METLDFITWFGHASFSFLDKTSGNRIYYIDPYDLRDRELEKADLVFITHAHQDHASYEDLQKILKDDSVVCATKDTLEQLPLPDSQKHTVTPNQMYTVKDFNFKTIPAYNTHPDKLNFHPQSNGWVGYMMTINQTKLYHAGDTDFIPEMKRLNTDLLDIAMLPMGGTYTMDAHEAANAANVIQARITIPMHYKRLLGNKFKDAEEILKKEVKNSKVVILKEVQ